MCALVDALEDLGGGEECGGPSQGNLTEMCEQQLLLNGADLKLLVGFGDGLDLILIKIEFKALLKEVVSLGIDHLQVDGMPVIDRKDLEAKEAAGTG